MLERRSGVCGRPLGFFPRRAEGEERGLEGLPGGPPCDGGADLAAPASGDAGAELCGAEGMREWGLEWPPEAALWAAIVEAFFCFCRILYISSTSLLVLR